MPGASIDREAVAYLDALPPQRRERFMRLHELVLSLYPDATVDMSYKMPTYRAGEGWVALANQKHYISLYTCGYHHIAVFKEKHPEQKSGKGCINFKDRDELPMEDLQAVIRNAMEHPKG